MKKLIRNIIILLYAIIAIFVTICLLSYNEYKVSEFGHYSFVIIDNNKLEPNFKQGDLVVVDKDKQIEVGDKIFFYNTFERTMAVSLAEVVNKEDITETQITYTLEGDKKLSSDYVIGTSKETKTIGAVGGILGLLESKWGFLILVVLPALLAFLYEIFEIFTEMRGNKKKASEVKNEGKQDQ